MADIKIQFKNWKKKLDSAIKETLEDELFKEVKKVMKEKIQSEVYDKYEPAEYERRYENGGLLDEKNMVKTIIGYRTLIVENVTNDNGYTGTNRNIVPIIEQGKGYTWYESEIYKSQPFPRPFHKPAEEELVSSGRAKRALLNGLRRKGFETNI